MLQQLIVGIEALIKMQTDGNKLQETTLELSATQSQEQRVQSEALAKLLIDLKAITETGNEAVISVLQQHAENMNVGPLKESLDALVSRVTEDKADEQAERKSMTEALTKVHETLLNLLEESKKKEQFDYDIEITPELFRKLKGKDGVTPKKGEDYFTAEEVAEIVSRATNTALENLRTDLKAFKVPTADEIIAKIKDLPQGKQLEISDINGLAERLPPDLTEAVSRLAARVSELKNGTMGTGPIESLSNVDLTGLQDGYALKYDAASKTWKPGPASGGGGSTWGGITGDINTQADLIALLNGKSDVGHTHDDRYYTETEIDSQMAGKSNVGHSHTSSSITDFDTAVDANIDAKVSELVKGGVQFNLYRSAGLQVGDGFRTVVPFAGTITGWVIATKDGTNADITLNVKKAAYADVPTFAAIDGTEPIKLTAQNKNTDTTLTDWTTNVSAGDHVEITVESVTGIIAGVYGIINITKTT